MIKHIAWLSQYCEATWTQHTHARAPVPRPYTYRARRTPAEVEEARIQRALTGSLNTGIIPRPRTAPKGRGGKSFACHLFPVIGDGRVPHAPYTGTQEHTDTRRHGARRPQRARPQHACSARCIACQHAQHAIACGSQQLPAVLRDTTAGYIAAVQGLCSAQLATMPQVHAHAPRGPSLLQQGSSEGVHSGTNTKATRPPVGGPLQKTMPQVNRACATLTVSTLSTNSHSTGAQATETSAPFPASATRHGARRGK